MPSGRTDHARASNEEFARRRAALEHLLEEAEVEALLVYGNEAARHDIRYLTGWPAGWDTFVCWAPGALPQLFLPSPNHVPTAAAMTDGAAVARDPGPDPVAAVATELTAAAGRSSRRVGLLGPLPMAAHARLSGLLGAIDLVDVSAAFRRARLVKSEEEIAWTRRAAALCDTALTTLLARMRPGARDDALVASVEHAYRRRGGEHGICFLASTPMSGGGRVVPAQYASRRRLEHGDAVMIELSAGVAGATSQILRTIALDRPVPAAFRRLHDVADAAFRAIAAAIRPGARAEDLLAAAGVIDDAGLTVVDDVVHGYGGGYLPPVLRTPATQRGAVPDLALVPGMMLVVQPNVVDPARRMAVQTGELLVVTPTGCDRAHRTAMGLLMARGA